MKKTLGILLTLTLMISAFAGCGQSEQTSEPEAKPAAQEAETTPVTEEKQEKEAEAEAAPAEAVKWPTEAVTIISPSRAGGFADANTRILADYLQRTTGVPFAVVNQADGGGNIGTDMVRTAKPDGNTLLHFHTSFPISSYTGKYDGDPQTDFTTIAATQVPGSHVFAAKADAPYSTIEELVAYAKENPGKVKWGTATGVTSHFMMAMLEREAGVKFGMVDAGNEGERVTSILGGFIDVSNFAINNADQHVQAGDMKILGVIGDERVPGFDQYPTIKEQGYDVSWSGAFGLWGPADMDPALVQAINESLAGFGDDETVKEAFKKFGATFKYMNVEETQAYFNDQYEELKSIAVDLGF